MARRRRGALYVTARYTFLAAFWFSLFGYGYKQAVLLTALAGFVVILSASLVAGFSALQAPRCFRLAGSSALVSMMFSYAFFPLQYVPKGEIESVAVASLAALALARLQFDPMDS